MESSEIRKRFLGYFQNHGHVVVPSSSLIPDDPSVLLTTAGMQQFKKYYTGEADPLKDFVSKNTASIQKSFRTSDIDEVGDATHNTFFEMLGNFSFGGYGKREAITFAHGLITEVLSLPISYVTVFKGSANVSKDLESKAIWNELGVVDIREEGMDDVFWGPTGSSGPCGPTTELYCKNADGKDVEIWNVVFNQFFYPGTRDELLSGTSDKNLEPLKIFGVDTGAGLERVAMIVQGKKSNYETDLFLPLISLLPTDLEERIKRIVTDHIRASAFLLADGLRPSNKGAGYVLRRLLRRVLAYERTQNISPQVFESVLLKIIELYGSFYPELESEKNTVINEFWMEQERFSKTLEAGIKETYKFVEIDAPTAFNLYQSFGISLDVIRDVAGEKVKGLTNEAFDAELKKHQEVSRAGLEKKFGGHGLLLDTGELKAGNEEELKKVTRLHTATHLLQTALRRVLGDDVHQMGSDITAERTRFDFSFSRKVTKEELAETENIVNEAIMRDYAVEAKKMPYEEATKTGALYFFKEKYPAEVNVYSVYDKKSGEIFSHEFCGGPHVSHTGEIGSFKILKEESSSAGVRRIRGTVTP